MVINKKNYPGLLDLETIQYEEDGTYNPAIEYQIAIMKSIFVGDPRILAYIHVPCTDWPQWGGVDYFDPNKHWNRAAIIAKDGERVRRDKIVPDYIVEIAIRMIERTEAKNA